MGRHKQQMCTYVVGHTLWENEFFHFSIGYSGKKPVKVSRIFKENYDDTRFLLCLIGKWVYCIRLDFSYMHIYTVHYPAGCWATEVLLYVSSSFIGTDCSSTLSYSLRLHKNINTFLVFFLLWLLTLLLTLARKTRDYFYIFQADNIWIG